MCSFATITTIERRQLFKVIIINSRNLNKMPSNLYLIGEFFFFIIILNSFLVKLITFLFTEGTLPYFSKKTLPTYEHVLRRLLYLIQQTNLTVNESIERVVGELVSVWSNFSIITRKKSTVKALVKKFYLNYKNLKKCRNRRNSKIEHREYNFKLIYPQLFDISPVGWY